MNGQDKATITNLDDPGQSVECTFRPKELTVSKQNTWTPGRAKGKDAPKLEFGGGGSAKMQLELLFDTSRDGGDVREKTTTLWKMMLIDKNNSRTYNGGTKKGRPPRVQFQWGTMQSFAGIIESINQKFVLFKADGTPVRAVVNLSLSQFIGGSDQEARWVPQNPTSAGSGGYKMHTIRQGETLDLIAFQEYGDPNQWRYLATVNRLLNPLRLRPGQLLHIPPAE